MAYSIFSKKNRFLLHSLFLSDRSTGYQSPPFSQIAFETIRPFFDLCKALSPEYSMESRLHNRLAMNYNNKIVHEYVLVYIYIYSHKRIKPTEFTTETLSRRNRRPAADVCRKSKTRGEKHYPRTMCIQVYVRVQYTYVTP